MKSQRIVLAFALSIAASGAASAQEYRGTMQQQMACTPDVWRLCSEHVPDVGRITNCLRMNTPNLSGGCRAVFESNAQQADSRAVQGAPRMRSGPPPRQQPQYQQPQYEQPQYQQPQYQRSAPPPGIYLPDDDD